MTTEADVQRTIIEALVFDGWLVLRINQGGATYVQDGFDLEKGEIKKRYVTFTRWQTLGQEPTGKGIADVLVMKGGLDINRDMGYMDGHVGPRILAIEVKAPGKKANVSQAQADFLAAIEEHGGTAIVADCLEDVAPYLDRVEVQ